MVATQIMEGMRAAFEKMTAAKKLLHDQQRDEPLNLEKSKQLFRELSVATDEYVVAVDAYIARSKSSSEGEHA